MASTSSSDQQNAFSAIETPKKRRKIEVSSRVFDVFINHRGPDVKETLATQLYNSLKALGISAFLDSKEKELGISFTSIIEAAVRSASVHIAIFSKRYAESAWCLAELDLMLQTNTKIISVFYQVEPWELRHIEKGVYAEAFRQHKEKGRYLDKLEDWKKALQTVSYTAGVVLNPDSIDCKDIVSAVEDEVKRKEHLCVAKYPVGLHKLVGDFERRCVGDLIKDFERNCRMKKTVKGKANVVGIFGMGGVGKTTLSKELFNQKISKYTKASFLFDVREACASGRLPSLQSKLLKDIFGEDRDFHSSEEGTSRLRNFIERTNALSFLIVLDDIDHVEQLESLLVMDMLKKFDNNLVIITTRNVGVLVSAGIDIGYHLKGLDGDDGRELFCWHAFDQPHPDEGYEDLVQNFVNMCGGLPLSLIVLGRHVSHRARWYWEAELKKVKETLPTDIRHRLKISIDTLDNVEKQIFMDIACFFIGISVTTAMLIWNGSGWRARRALETLKERCLIEEVKEEAKSSWESTPVGYVIDKYYPVNMLKFYWESPPEIYAFRMHDHLRDLGREMAYELSNPHRVWRVQDLKSLESNGFQNILTQTKSRTFHSTVDKSIGCKITYFLGKPKDGSDASLLWLQLEYLSHSRLQLDINSSIGSRVPLQNLQCLRIMNGCFQKLWQSDVEAPSHLEEFQIRDTSVEEFPDLLGKLSNMKKLVLDATDIQTDIWSLLESLKMNFSSFRMVSHKLAGHLAYDDAAEETALKSLLIYDLERPLERRVDLNDEGWCRTVMSGLESLEISRCEELKELRLAHLSCLKSISIEYCEKIQHIILPTSLIKLDVQCCRVLQRVAVAGDHPKHTLLQNITLPTTLTSLSVRECTLLQGIAGIADLIKLTWLCIVDSPKLKKLPLSRLNCLEEIEIGSCEKLQKITLPTTLSKLDIYGCTVLQRIAGIADLIKLRRLCIVDCPKLQELPLSRLNCLEATEIESCKKLQNITLPTTLTSLSIYKCTVLQGIAGIADLIKLPRLCIVDCPKLKKLPLSRLKCLEEIEIGFCEKLQKITLPTTLSKLDIYGCTVLQGIAGIADLIKLTRLCIVDCPKLQELPLSSLNCLEEMKIKSCKKLQNITLPTTLTSLSIYKCTVLQGIAGIADLIKLPRLCIVDCPKLKKLPLSRLNCLEEIEIGSCEKLQKITLPTTLSKLDIYGCTVLQRIAGIADLIKLRRLCIVDCPKLQELPLSRLNCLEATEIESCEELEKIMLPTTLSKLDIYGCTVLQGIAGIADLIKLTRLCIVDCPKLQKLVLCRLNCLKATEIESCEELEKIMLPTTLVRLSVKECRVLHRVAGLPDITKLTDLCIADCPALELLCPGRLICLERFDIDLCENLKIISRIDEFHVPNYTRLTYCGYAVTRYFIDRLKNLPRHTWLIGKAVDGAESSLKELLLSEANIAVDGVTEISTDNYYPDWSGLDVFILCFVVVIDSSTSAEEINDDLKMRQGESLVTVVESSGYSKDVTVVESSEYSEDGTELESSEYSEDGTELESSEYSEDGTELEYSQYETWELLKDYVRIMKKGFRVDLKEGEEWKSLPVLRTIVDRLYDKE